MLNTVIYFSIIGFLAAASYGLFSLTEQMTRSVNGVLRELSSIVPSILLFSITALTFANGQGYPAITRDGLVIIIGISATMLSYLGLRGKGKYNAVANNTERKFASMLIFSVIVCFTVAPSFIPDFKNVRWHWLSGLMGLIAFFLLANIRRQDHISFARHLMMSKKTNGTSHSGLLLIWILAGVSVYGLALHFLSQVSFDVNTSLNISDTSFALLLTLPLIAPVLIRAYRIGVRHSVPFAANLLSLYIASVSLGVMTVLTLASTITGVDIFFAITNIQLLVVLLSLASFWQFEQLKSSTQSILCGYAAAVLLLSQFI